MTRADVRPIRRGYSYHVIRFVNDRSQIIQFGSRSVINAAGLANIASRSTAIFFHKDQSFGPSNVERCLTDGISQKLSPKMSGNNLIYDQNCASSTSIVNMDARTRETSAMFVISCTKRTRI